VQNRVSRLSGRGFVTAVNYEVATEFAIWAASKALLVFPWSGDPNIVIVRLTTERLELFTVPCSFATPPRCLSVQDRVLQSTQPRQESHVHACPLLSRRLRRLSDRNGREAANKIADFAMSVVRHLQS